MTLRTLGELASAFGTDKASHHHNFCPLYERYLGHLRGLAATLVELGVYEGESMRMWGNYFDHPNAAVLGVDIDLSRVGGFLPMNVAVFRGDQADPRVAAEVTKWRSDIDVLIDDASHISSKTIESFKVWWPHVKPGGLYVVEDIHCAYDTEFYGCAEASKIPASPFVMTTMGFLQRLADEVNFEVRGTARFAPSHHMGYGDIEFVHFYKSICFIGKAP